MPRLIDADALLKEIERIYSDHYEKSCYKFIHDFFNAMRRRIRRCTTVDAVEVVHGRWNPRPHHKFNSEGRLIKYCDFYYCSECGTERPIVPPYKYCPNCGAKMDGDGNG